MSFVFAEQTDDAVFFQQLSQSAYNSVFGLPTVASRFVAASQWQMSLEHSNQFMGGDADGESLTLDGESSRLSITHKQRLSDCWQTESSLPLIAHNGGKFDRAIDDWHQFFGLPDANRDGTDFDQLTYQYLRAGIEQHAIVTPQSGIGDVTFSVQRALGCSVTSEISASNALVRFGVKLPTGDPDELTGSGELDFFADWQSGIRFFEFGWSGALALGVLQLGQTDRFAEQKNLAMYGSLGTHFPLSHRWRLIAQLDGRSAFYDSALRELGDPAFNVAVGARFISSTSYTYEFSISEDAAIDTTPDIVARLSVSYQPALKRR